MLVDTLDVSLNTMAFSEISCKVPLSTEAVSKKFLKYMLLDC